MEIGSEEEDELFFLLPILALVFFKKIFVSLYELYQTRIGVRWVYCSESIFFPKPYVALPKTTNNQRSYCIMSQCKYHYRDVNWYIYYLFVFEFDLFKRVEMQSVSQSSTTGIDGFAEFSKHSAKSLPSVALGK
jgi:hypothetical protein